ncbi:MAG TPA: TadE/TadG family type IV pilus assembly protein [Azospirillum sp.]|nr:TadE/TadG family type IV pilus assembly protein [Azospirillum sp.]
MTRLIPLLTRPFHSTLAGARGGNISVEFALALPFLLLILGAVIDFGRAAYDRMALETAARSAVQYARVNPTDSAGIRRAALSAGGVDPAAQVNARQFCECPDGGASPCTSVCPAGEAPQVFLEVTVNSTFTPLLPVPGLPVLGSLTGSATLRVQ